MTTWFFNLDGETIQLMARIGDDNLISLLYEELRNGDFHGISYEAMREAKTGTLEIDDTA